MYKKLVNVDKSYYINGDQIYLTLQVPILLSISNIYKIYYIVNKKCINMNIFPINNQLTNSAIKIC